VDVLARSRNDKLLVPLRRIGTITSRISISNSNVSSAIAALATVKAMELAPHQIIGNNHQDTDVLPRQHAIEPPALLQYDLIRPSMISLPAQEFSPAHPAACSSLNEDDASEGNAILSFGSEIGEIPENLLLSPFLGMPSQQPIPLKSIVRAPRGIVNHTH
jgi:hypothetical protein